MATETENTKTDIETAGKAAEGETKIEAGKATGASETDADKVKAEAAAKLEADKASHAAEVDKAAKKLAAKMVAEELAKAKREADEAAELAKKSDVERALATQKKLEERLAAAEASAAAATLKADLAAQLNEQDLRPASPKAAAHIEAAFKAHIAEGKDAAEAVKAVKAEEGYLFKQPAATTVVEPTKKPAATTGAKASGADDRATGDVSSARALAGSAVKNPGDLTNPREIREAMRAKHGLTIN